MDQFPDILIPIVSSMVYTEKNITIDTDEFDVDINFKPNSSEIPCFLLPKHEKLEVKYSWYSKDQIKPSRATNIINGLAPKNKDFKTIFMIFTVGYDDKFIDSIMGCIRKRYGVKFLYRIDSQVQ